MRHTAYNDYCAQARVMYLEELGLSMDNLLKMGVGPILFREEIRYFRELRMNREFEVGVCVSKLRKDGSKWSFSHNIYGSEGELSAKVEGDGAWLDLVQRRITVPSEEL